MTEDNVVEDAPEAVELYNVVDEARLAFHSLHDRGVTPEEEPGLWANLKGAVENVRKRATMLPAFDAVLDEGVAETPEEFLTQIESLDEETVRKAAKNTVDD